MNIIELLQDYSIPYVTEGHKHCREGWLNMECPFCTGNPGYHLGYNTLENYFHCWRCGGKLPIPTLSKLLHKTEPETYQLVKQYGGLQKRKLTTTTPLKIRLKAFKLPPTIPFQKRHLKYLVDRNFDPEKIIPLWNLQATGPIALLDDTDYKHRIIAPIVWDDKIVSFQGRDITERSTYKYLACSMARELEHHKHILYGQENKWGDSIFCVEGITDVWRLGPENAAATFGIKYTTKQLRQFVKFKNVFVLFDDDPQAIEQANKLVADLKLFTNAERVDIKGDPGSLKEDDVKHLIKRYVI